MRLSKPPGINFRKIREPHFSKLCLQTGKRRAVPSLFLKKDLASTIPLRRLKLCYSSMILRCPLGRCQT